MTTSATRVFWVASDQNPRLQCRPFKIRVHDNDACYLATVCPPQVKQLLDSEPSVSERAKPLGITDAHLTTYVRRPQVLATLTCVLYWLSA